MKKILFVLCMIFALTCCAAFAEGADSAEKITIWEYKVISADEAGNQVETDGAVTLQLAQPYDLVEIDTEATDGYVAKITRDGVAPVIVTIFPFDMDGLKDLNDISDEELALYAEMIGIQFEDYTWSKAVSEGGNVFVAVGDEYTRSVATIYDSLQMEILQFNENGAKLTAADQDFAVEVFQAIWTQH